MAFEDIECPFGEYEVAIPLLSSEVLVDDGGDYECFVDVLLVLVFVEDFQLVKWYFHWALQNYNII